LFDFFIGLNRFVELTPRRRPFSLLATEPVERPEMPQAVGAYGS
jgi:hypothetical protein